MSIQKKNISLEAYLDVVKSTLEAALCLVNFGSQNVERHNKPEIEAAQHAELLLKPVVIQRSQYQKVCIEGSINSVRVSAVVSKMDDLDEILTARFLKFLTQRAEHFVVLRRKPMDGYDISFLITNFNIELMYKHKIVDFVIQFLNDIEQEVKLMKMDVNQRARVVANSYLSSFR